MAPPTPLSPPELSYLHSSLSLHPALRPDLRTPTQFRPIIAECSILPACNGSSRICMPEAGECIVGIKAELERDSAVASRQDWLEVLVEVAGGIGGVGVSGITGAGGAAGRDEGDGGASVWLKEGLLAGGNGVSSDKEMASLGLLDRLVVSKGWHWKLYIDVLLLTPTTHPSPLLLSTTLNLALTSTFLPKLASSHEVDDIPAFSDDWGLATPLYAPNTYPKPPISLPVIAIADNIFLDPSNAEVAVAEVGLVVTILQSTPEGDGEVVGVRSMEVGRGGATGGKSRKGMSRALVKDMVNACFSEAVDVVQELDKTARKQLAKEGQ